MNVESKIHKRFKVTSRKSQKPRPDLGSRSGAYGNDGAGSQGKTWVPAQRHTGTTEGGAYGKDCEEGPCINDWAGIQVHITLK